MTEMIAAARAARADIYRKQAARVLKALERRGVDGTYVETAAGAADAVRRLVPSGARVALGGSVTLFQSGVLEALRGMDVRLIDRYAEGLSRDDVMALRREGLTADVLVSGCNAVTLDGRLVSQDAIGNRVAAMAFGPGRVILVAGMNKIAADLDDALARIRTIAAPMDAAWLGIETPCARTGACAGDGCRPPHRLCGPLLIIESSWFPGRVHVVLVGEDLGF